MQSAVDYLDSVISTPITVTIDFGWGEVAGQSLATSDIGESSFNGA